MKTLLWIFTIVFFSLSWWWYVCPHKQVCPFGNYSLERSLPVENASKATNDKGDELMSDQMTPAQMTSFDAGEVFFNWSSDRPYISGNFTKIRDSILQTLGETDLLKITGYYAVAEENKTAFPDLGFARANKSKLLFRSLGSDRFRLESAKIVELLDSDRGRPQAAVSFERMVQNASIRDIGEKVIINFPYASDDMLENPQVDAYLSDLVDQLKNSGEYAYIVGHTDDSASAQRNLSLGWQRANTIRSLLLSKGLSANQIISESAGESDPIASNDTKEGRRQNRRVEVTILKDLN